MQQLNLNKKYLFVTRGLPGSGKSTFVKNNFQNFTIICPDVLRKEEFKRLKAKYSLVRPGPINEHKIWVTAFNLLEKSLQVNKYTVFDATNTLERYLTKYNKLCKQYDAQLVIISFEKVDIEICKERNKCRTLFDFVPEDVIDRMKKQLSNSIQGETKNYVVDYDKFDLTNYN